MAFFRCVFLGFHLPFSFICTIAREKMKGTFHSWNNLFAIFCGWRVLFKFISFFIDCQPKSDEEHTHKKKNGTHPRLCYRKYPSVYIKHLLNNLNVRIKNDSQFFNFIKRIFWGRFNSTHVHIHTHTWYGMAWVTCDANREKNKRNPFAKPKIPLDTQTTVWQSQSNRE